MSPKKMSISEKKFWMSPELLDRFLPFLDVSSTLHLAQAHQFTVQVLKAKPTWNKFMMRTCPNGECGAEENKAAVVAQAKLLKLMGIPEDFLQDLLDAVAKSFPRAGFSCLDQGRGAPCLIRVNCPCLEESHAVSNDGFLLLEEIEGELGTVKQEVVQAGVQNLEGLLLTALTNRLSRQEGLATSMRVDDCTATLDDLSCLIRNCESVTIKRLIIVGEGTTEGWAALAKGLSKKKLQIGRMNSFQSQMSCARAEDLEATFHAVTDGWIVIGRDQAGNRVTCYGGGRLAEGGEGGWQSFKQGLEIGEGDGRGSKEGNKKKNN